VIEKKFNSDLKEVNKRENNKELRFTRPSAIDTK